MPKRPFQILSVALLLLAAGWTLRSARNAPSDEARYHQWQRPMDTWRRLVLLERHLPASLCRAFNLSALEQWYLDTDDKIEERLVTSGYLATVDIAVTNAEACRTQIGDRLSKASQGNETKWMFFIRSNATVVLTCRPRDAGLCIHAVEGR